MSSGRLFILVIICGIFVDEFQKVYYNCIKHRFISPFFFCIVNIKNQNLYYYTSVCPKGFGGDRKAPKTKAQHLLFKPPLRRRLEAAGVTTGQGRALSYRAFPLPKQSTGLF